MIADEIRKGAGVVIHVSDIHFGAEDPAALEVVHDHVQRLKPSALLVAGDITQNGIRREFAAARAWFDRLETTVITTPGNHDTPAVHLPHHFPRRLASPFSYYRQYFGDLDGATPTILNSGLMQVVSLNTARGVQGRLNWANGVIRLEDLNTALNLLKEGRPDAWRILLCHHPLREPGHSEISVDTRRGGVGLQRCRAAGVDVVLSGHVHDAFAHAMPASRRALVQMGSGTLSTRLRATPPSFCIIQCDADGRLTQDVVSIGRHAVETRRNYDSRIAPTLAAE